MPIRRTGAEVCRKLAIAFASAALLGLLLGSLGRFGWLLDLPSHFRVQYAAVLLICAIALFVLRPRWLGVVALLAAAGCCASVARYIALADPAVVTRAPVLRVVSFNVWHRNGDTDRLARYLEASNADVLVLQELTLERARRLASLLPSYPHSFTESAEPHGAVVFSRLPLQASERLPLAPDGVRATRVELNWHGETITIVGAHLHWPLGAARLRNAELNGLAALARSHTGPLVIVGDFNTTPWSGAFSDVVAQSGLADCARGHGWLATWPAQFPPLGIRIDQCLASAHWQVIGAEVGPRVGSDHLPTAYALAFATRT